MPVLSEQEFRDRMGGLSSLSSSCIARHLATARTQVKRDGVAEKHENFADLQQYFAAHILDAGWLLDSYISSRSVGDVSTSFGSMSKEVHTWHDLYKALLTSVRGLSGRIA